MNKKNSQPSKIKVAIIGVPTNVHLERRLHKINYQKYHVTIISPIPIENNIQKQFDVFWVDISRFTFLKHFRYFYEYARFILREHFDVIYCFGALSPLSWLTGILCQKYLIISTLGVDVYLNDQVPMSQINKMNIKKLIQNADMVSTLSSSMCKRLLGDFKVSASKISMEFLDIENEWYLEKDASTSNNLFSGHYPVIFSPRILRPLYRQEEIIETLALLKERYPKLFLVQSGFCIDPLYYEKCIKLIQNLDLINHVVILKDQKKLQDRIEVFDQCDIVLMIPSSDGMSSSMIEAWARKKPVVVSDIENYDSSYDGKLFIKTEVDKRSLSQAIIKVLGNEELRCNLIKKSWEHLIKTRDFHKDNDIFAHAQQSSQKNILSKIYRSVLFLLFLIEPWFTRKKA